MKMSSPSDSEGTPLSDLNPEVNGLEGLGIDVREFPFL